MKTSGKIFLGTLCAALLGSCGGGGGSTLGTVRVNLTDAPACGFDHVYISVDHIDFSKDDGVSWTSVPVDSTLSRLDLLSLQNGVLTQLAQKPLAAGTYNQVRLVLKDNGNAAPWANAVVVSGSAGEAALGTPSGQQSGYKIKGPFTVAADTLADLDLDFNACQSVVTAGNSGKFNLKPVVRAVARTVSGSIEGTTTAGAAVHAQQDGAWIASTIAATSGAFKLAPLVQSSSGGNYDVVIVPDTTLSSGTSTPTTAIVQQVVVTAGAATSLGTITPANTTLRAVIGTVRTANQQAAAASMSVTQRLSSGKTYLLAIGSNNPSTGAYRFALPGSAAQLGTYSASSPLSFSPDSATAGVYAISAVNDAGLSATAAADLHASDATVDLTLGP